MQIFNRPETLNVNGKLLSMEKPLVMGILNITPDSFYDGGKWNNDLAKTTTEAGKMLDAGASIIDVGGYSSRPGAKDISVKEEAERVLPVIESIVKYFPDATVSIDTFRSEVASQAVKAGAGIVNDISGGSQDANMFPTVAALHVPYILMHMRGTPQTMQQKTDYDDIFKQMLAYFYEKVTLLRKLGCKDIIIDPGFGFAKNLDQNYWLLSHLDEFKILNLPMLVGVSRKSMIYKKLGIDPKKALNGTTVLNTVALQKGAKILRVHDVTEAVEIIKLLYT
jgi:dihydropteroate synthase